jgi:hypothetical protein
MGREIQCRAKYRGERFAGKALLETSEILFRGDLRLKVPFAELESTVARNGELHLKWSGNSAVFELGEQAEKWAHAILHPKSTASKLGIKPGLKISAVHTSDDNVMRNARKAASAFAHAKPLPDSDMIFFGVETVPDLSAMKKLIASLASNGALWIIYPKGRKDITELQVLTAGRAAALVDVKVVSYSATHTALKFVRPRDKR